MIGMLYGGVRLDVCRDVVIPRVRAVLPFADVRFLVMLRDPGECLSAWTDT